MRDPKRHFVSRTVPRLWCNLCWFHRLLPTCDSAGALAKLPNIYIFTHDSIGVGEDGPTHEPVETVSSVRLIPNIDVIRPADPEETAGAFAAAMQRIEGPTFLALTRQTVPILNQIDVNLRREGVLRGGYITKKESESST